MIVILSSPAFAGRLSRSDYRRARPVKEIPRTSFVVDLFLTDQIDTLEITQNITLDDVTINVSQSTTVNTGETICIKEGNRFYQGQVVATASGEIKVDARLDYAFTTAATITRTEHDLAASTSVTGDIYQISPPTGAIWHITRLLFYIEGTSAMDDGKFGDGAALTNGILIRKKDGVYQNIFNIKSNGELAQRAYDRFYSDKAPAGVTSINARRTFSGMEKNGVVIELDGSTSDELQVVVGDDLTGQTHVYIIAQGYVYER